eukprot:CAMPEP_0182448772 /NCGR_PEP_ID=MMETSP1172-20130603/29671_1 /TAXON_ID=708627 /ORGANISM="Timspurckia oligopyrenoides, Strain CCMP3278" /LENGTH=45 /DNA_ID= /DNA_START= /DNA_END= /DNA_ORIENTATION=
MIKWLIMDDRSGLGVWKSRSAKNADSERNDQEYHGTSGSGENGIK